MKPIQQYTHIFFIGIGGIGMSALARYFNQKELKVLGYDKTKTELTQTLTEEGVEVYYQQEIKRERIENTSSGVYFSGVYPCHFFKFHSG